LVKCEEISALFVQFVAPGLFFVAIFLFNVTMPTVSSSSNDIAPTRSDTGALATLIIELNIARRNSRAYPTGHPVVAASLTKVLHVYDVLMRTQGEILLGVTSDSLMVDGVTLEKSNLVYRDFSRVLFERGIGALQFHRGLTNNELISFSGILGLKREQIQQDGGIEQVWATANISAITIRPIRYDLFHSSDDDSSVGYTGRTGEGLWDKFARELTRGSVPEGYDETCLDPEILAEILNQHNAEGTTHESDIHDAITAFLTPAHGNPAAGTPPQPYKKLAAFISHLTPELRRQFLESSFGTNSLNRQAAAEGILGNLSDTALIETLEDINKNRLNVSSTVFGLLQRLGRNADLPPYMYEDLSSDEDLSRKMKTIFREHAIEEFVPDNYQKKLNQIIAAVEIPRLEMEEVTDLLKTFESRFVENSIGEILMNLIRAGVETAEERELLLQNLSDMYGFYLETGDFGQLHRMIDQVNDGTFPDEIQYRLREEYGQRSFLEEILDGLTIWGKPRYGDIRSLILKIGGQFIEVILDRLAEDRNMSLRRFYMDCLIEMGPITQVPIVGRLYDTRWYFLRNLLIVLAAQNDASVVPQIRRLLHNEDPRLRLEALKTLLNLRDPQAEQQILHDLDSQNPEQQSAAIQLAERCSSLAIAVKLSNMLALGGFSQAECEKKSALVNTLSEIGRADILPSLAKILASWSLLHSRHLTKLKADIIRSLPKYSATVSRPILERISHGTGVQARLAAETLNILSGKSV
jgi:hypothetical protein